MRFFSQKSGFIFQALKLETFFSDLDFSMAFFTPFCELYCTLSKNQTDIENLLPNQGILQFFISPDDEYYGMDSDNYQNQEKIRVVYHENINFEITEKEIQDIVLENFDTELPKTFGPVQEEAKLSIKSRESFLSLDDEKFQEIFQESVKEIFGEETEDDYRTFLDDKNFDNGNKYGHQFFREILSNVVD